MIITAEVARDYVKSAPETFFDEIVQEISDKIKREAEDQKDKVTICFNGIEEFDALSDKAKWEFRNKINQVFWEKDLVVLA